MFPTASISAHETKCVEGCKPAPVASRQIFGILDVVRKRKAEEEEEAAEVEEGGEIQVHSLRKNQRTVAAARIPEQENKRTIKQLDEEVITEDVIQSCLLEAIEAQQGSLGCRELWKR